MFYPIASAVGLTASGLVAGLTLSYPLLVNDHFKLPRQGEHVVPASSTPDLNVAQRLTLWNRAYYAGHWCPLFAGAAAISLLSTLKVKQGLASKLIIAASLLHVSIGPFTLLAIKPVNDRLTELRKKANEATPVNEEEVSTLFSQWAALHNVRVAASVLGFAVAVVETLGLYRHF